MLNFTVIVLIALGIAPFAILLAIRRPIIFPLGLYVLMVPFDNILGTTTTITRLVAIGTAATLVLSMVVNRRVLAPPKSWVAWAAYILLASLSALWTIDPKSTSIMLAQMVQLFLFYTILAMYPVERKDVRMLGAIIVAAGTLSATIGLASYIGGYRTQENRLSIELGGLVLDPNHIAAALLLPLALAIGTLILSRDLWLRVCSAAATVTMVVALFLTGSRGGLIALAVMLLYLAWKTRYRLQILGLMAVFGVASLFEPTVWERFADKGLTGGSGRIFIWDVGRSAFKDHWLNGAGIGAFPSAYNHSLLTTFQPLFQGWSRPAHNALLSSAVELGILGAVLLVYAWWRSWSDAKGNVVIEAAIIGLAVAAWFLDVLSLKYVWLVFTMAALVKNAAEPHFLRGSPRGSLITRRQKFRAQVEWRARRFGTAQIRSNREA